VRILSDDSGNLPPIIPEPLTMLGVLAGIGGLGSYLRRRRLAVAAEHDSKGLLSSDSVTRNPNERSHGVEAIL
jgi:hypothetical protein